MQKRGWGFGSALERQFRGALKLLQQLSPPCQTRSSAHATSEIFDGPDEHSFAYEMPDRVRGNARLRLGHSSQMRVAHVEEEAHGEEKDDGEQDVDAPLPYVPRSSLLAQVIHRPFTLRSLF